MITFLAVIYFLKSVLNFDVFSGPVFALGLHQELQQHNNKDKKTSSSPGDDKQDDGGQDGSQESCEAISESSSNSNDDDECDKTVDKSYDVSAWDQTNAALTDSEDADNDGEDGVTNITSVTDSSEEEREEFIELEREINEEENDNDNEEELSEGCDIESEDEYSTLFQTEWYRIFEEKAEWEANKRWIVFW